MPSKNGIKRFTQPGKASFGRNAMTAMLAELKQIAEATKKADEKAKKKCPNQL